MVKYTPNYNLGKPEGTDLYSVLPQNTNMDIIDTKLKEIEVDTSTAIDESSIAFAKSEETQQLLADHLADYTQKIKSLNKARCLINSSVDTLLQPSTTTLMQLNLSVNHQDYYSWNSNTNKVTFLKSGTYMLSTALSLINTPIEQGRTVYVIPRINNGSSAFGQFFPRLVTGGGGTVNVSGTMLISVSAGDTMYLEAYHGFTTTVNAKGQIDIINMIEV